MHLNASLAQCNALEAICNSHEQASAMAAENYAKATNHLGVAMVTTGPGGTNTITGLAGAWLDSTPVLFLSGQVKRPDRMFAADGTPLGMRQLGVQEVDILSIVKPLTKYAVTILDPATIRYHLEKAIYLALNGRPGPVWIDIPLDVQAAPIDETQLTGFDPTAEYPQSSGTDAKLAAQVREVINILNRSERPLIFIGNGVRLARAEDELRKLFSVLEIPVEATWCAADIISSEHPLFVGRPGSLASRGANFALQNSDFLLSIGARLDFAITGYAPDRFARAAHKIMVDIDAAEIAKLSPFINTPVCADGGAFLREMLRQIESVQPKDRTAWKERCADWKTRYPVVLDEHRKAEGRVSIFNLAEIIGQESTPEDLMISGNSGSGIEIFLFACHTRTGQRIFHTAGLGAMGCALPNSIGVCLAGGRKRTICVDGDGGFMFNIQELATVRHHNLPIKFFILNNDGYASIRASQANFFGAPLLGCDDGTGLLVPDLCNVAASFGIATARISSQENLREQVRSVLEMPGPVVCDVRVIPDEVRGPRLSSMQRADGSLVSKPLEDLWPFLDREEFQANMIIPILEE
jgi:acetolactate synthase-1/2/3 large subunit